MAAQDAQLGQLGQYGIARKHFAEALQVRRDLRDRSGVAWSLINLGEVAQAQGIGARIAGIVEAGPKRLLIEPLDIVFGDDALNLR